MRLKTCGAQVFPRPCLALKDEACQHDFAEADSIYRGTRKRLALLLFVCDSLRGPNFSQMLEKMAGTTRLELATSAVTAQRFDVID